MAEGQSRPVELATLSIEDESTEDTLKLAEIEREKQGPCEVEISYGGEADLHRHLENCKKNPQHTKFIPMDKNIMIHLISMLKNSQKYQPGQHPLIEDIITSLSDLTVRVTVKYASDKRPQTWPESDEPYPRYENRPRRIRFGTGCVRRVFMETEKSSNEIETCPCKECLASPTPKTEFGYIVIATAAHVVYDDLEAAHTTCHLFFDNGGTPETCSGVVTLDNMSSLRCNTARDWCEMTYVTHDQHLMTSLMIEVDSLSANILLVKERIHSRNETMTTNAADHEDFEPITVIVSHPHGGCKKISLGYCRNYDEDYLDKKEYTYSTPTCPGSSGALVLILHDCYFYDLIDYVHHGNKAKNLNYCKYIYNFFHREMYKALREYKLHHQ